MKDCILCGIEDNNPTLIKKFDNWTLLVNYMQPTLGSTLLVLNRHIPGLSDINDREAKNYFGLVKNLENALRKSFDPPKN